MKKTLLVVALTAIVTVAGTIGGMCAYNKMSNFRYSYITEVKELKTGEYEINEITKNGFGKTIDESSYIIEEIDLIRYKLPQ